MRSTIPAGWLSEIADLVDRASAEQPDHLLVHLDGPLGPAANLGIKVVAAELHPFEVLAGFTAPDTWTAFGIRVRGRARHLDDPHAGPVPTAVTLLLGRDGQEVSRLRRAGRVTELAGPALGTVPDLCRCVLGLPTAPAPPSTVGLWTTMWLDRVLDAWGRPHLRRALTCSWAQVAALHPAMADPSFRHRLVLADPASLVEQASAHGRRTSWRRVRCSAVPLTLPDGPIDRAVTRWMDDGFFARWALGAFPSISSLTGDLHALLGQPIGGVLTEVVGALQD
jgi:hypothetical protein